MAVERLDAGWLDALRSVAIRHHEVITSGLRGPDREHAERSETRITRTDTMTVLRLCQNAILSFVRQEVDPALAADQKSKLVVAFRRPLRKVDLRLVDVMFAAEIELLVVCGFGTAAILSGAYAEDDAGYELIENPDSLVLELEQAIMYPLWLENYGPVASGLFEGDQKTIQLLEALWDVSTRNFLAMGERLGLTPKDKYRDMLRTFAQSYLIFGYALYLINTRRVREMLRDDIARLHAETVANSAHWGLMAIRDSHTL